MEVAHYVALRAHCYDLSRTFFTAITHAPTIYLMLGRSLDNLSLGLDRLCMEASHPNSRVSLAALFCISMVESVG